MSIDEWVCIDGYRWGRLNLETGIGATDLDSHLKDEKERR